MTEEQWLTPEQLASAAAVGSGPVLTPPIRFSHPLPDPRQENLGGAGDYVGVSPYGADGTSHYL
jgi:hypothetical protein